jgi:hypothetical protein
LCAIFAMLTAPSPVGYAGADDIEVRPATSKASRGPNTEGQAAGLDLALPTPARRAASSRLEALISADSSSEIDVNRRRAAACRPPAVRASSTSFTSLPVRPS